MTEAKKLACPYCGNSDGSRIFDGENGKLRCDFCNTSFFTETAEDFYKKLTIKLSEEEKERLQKNLKNLSREAQEKYPDRDILLTYSQKVKELEPDHPIANLYELLIKKADGARVSEYFSFLQSQKLTTETKCFIAKEFIKNLDLRRHQLALTAYISEEILSDSPEMYKELMTELEKKAEQENNEVFNARLRRDVFIAHSSKDVKKANEVAEALAASGRSFFLSSINLRHGLHAKSEYESSLREALKACSIFLMINTKNARKKQCDVYEKELPYIQHLDESAFPLEYRHVRYQNVPAALKKPRINFLVEGYIGTVQDSIVEEFFDGFEYRITENDVLMEVERLLRRQAAPVSFVNVAPGHEPKEKVVEASEKKQSQKISVQPPEERILQDVKKNPTSATKTASKGDPNKAYSLGFDYFKGTKKTPKNEEKAVELFLEAATQGHAKAQCWLGYCYETGNGVRKDEREAVGWYKKAAEQGEKVAQYNLGNCYYGGRGVPKDEKMAAEWYKKSAEQNYASAQNWLGFCLGNGRGVEKDEAAAIGWYQKAANKGDAEAQYNLGFSYSNGKGIEMDEKEAVKWYKKAAAQGIANAQSSLGFCYETGKGIDVDKQAAAEWYKKAALQGHMRAQFNLGLCYEYGKGVEKDEKEAVEWYKKAAEQGYANAQSNLGYCYETGKGIDVDKQAAAGWYKKAAEQGYARAQYNYGLCFEYGKGIAVDKNQAVLWYKKAAEQGHEGAKTRLDAINPKTEAVQKTVQKPLFEIRDGVLKKYLGKGPAVEIPTGVKEIGEMSFRGCSGIKSVTIPDGITRIGAYAFSGCSSLESITMPGSVVTIGSSAFSFCSSLTSITIAAGVKIIGGLPLISSNVFYGCDKAEITFLGTADAWRRIVGVTEIRQKVIFQPHGEHPSSAANLLLTYKNARVGQLVEFGHYPQSANGTDKTPIKWRVLENSGKELFLLSEMLLDSIPFDTESVQVTWYDSTLRKWLNNDFYNAAFSASEKGLISLTRCTGNGVGSTNELPETDDRVFLLNTREAEVMGDIGKRAAQGTEYAKKRGLWVNNRGKGNSYWWLRNRGSGGASCAPFVNSFGSVHDNGFLVSSDYIGVRPALKINLQSLT